jgi:hypothetical protein
VVVGDVEPFRLPILVGVDELVRLVLLSGGELEDAWELLEKTSRLLNNQLEYLSASGCFKYS